MMENDVLTMRICKSIIERNWVLAHYQIRAVQEGRVAQGTASHGGPRGSGCAAAGSAH